MLSLSMVSTESPGSIKVRVQCGIFGKEGRLGIVPGGQEQIEHWQSQASTCGSFVSGYIPCEDHAFVEETLRWWA